MSSSPAPGIPTAQSATRRRARIALGVLMLSALSIFLQIRWSPANHKIHVDGTVFAYAGARILEGDLPYRDFWDHKPPGVYYLNALAFWLLGVDAWSIWFLTVVWTIAVVGGFFCFLRGQVSDRYAFLASVILVAMIVYPRFYEAANLTEFYGLLPAVLALFLTQRYLASGRSAYLVGLGGTLAAGALLKHTNIATALTCVLAIMYVQIRRLKLANALRLMVPVLYVPTLTVGVILLFWGSRGALLDLWQAAIEYNIRALSGPWGPVNLYGKIRTIASDPAAGPLLILALGAALALWWSGRAWMLPHSHSAQSPPAGELTSQPIYAISVSALFLEILFISMARRGYGHYYMTLLPSLCAAVSYWFQTTPGKQPLMSSKGAMHPGISPIVAAGLLVWLTATFGLVRPSSDDLRSFALDAPVRRPLRTSVGKLVNELTDADDSVLVWGIGAEVNFETGRRSPSRYFYYLPLFLPGYQNHGRWEQFIADLETNQPAVLLAQRGGGFAPSLEPPLEQLASRCQCEGDVLAGFTAFAQYVMDNYEPDRQFDQSLIVYFPKNP